MGLRRELNYVLKDYAKFLADTPERADVQIDKLKDISEFWF